MKDIKKNKMFVFVATVLIATFPMIASAVTFEAFVQKILGYFESVAGVLISLAVFLLAYGIFRYINAGGDSKRLAEGGKLVMWGVIAVFVMVSMWGLANIILNTVFDSADSSDFSPDSQLWDTTDNP